MEVADGLQIPPGPRAKTNALREIFACARGDSWRERFGPYLLTAPCFLGAFVHPAMLIVASVACLLSGWGHGRRNADSELEIVCHGRPCLGRITAIERQPDGVRLHYTWVVDGTAYDYVLYSDTPALADAAAADDRIIVFHMLDMPRAHAALHPSELAAFASDRPSDRSPSRLVPG